MWKVPNVAEATYPQQARLYSSALADIVRAQAGLGMVSGGLVTAVSGMTINVASAVISVDLTDADVAVTAGNLTVSTAHPSLPRIDIVESSAAGVKSVKAGTAAPFPLEPETTTGAVKHAAIWVPAGLTTVTAGHLSDRRVFVAVGVAGPAGPPGASPIVLNSDEDATDVPPGTPEGTVVLRRYPL